MSDDTTSTDDSDPMTADPTDTLDLEHPDDVRIGVTRGEEDLEIGPPRDYPDRADISVRPEDDRVVVSVDAMAGDHGMGLADVVLTPTEARALGQHLDQTVRWMTGSGSDNEGTDGDGPDR